MELLINFGIVLGIIGIIVGTLGTLYLLYDYFIDTTDFYIFRLKIKNKIKNKIKDLIK